MKRYIKPITLEMNIRSEVSLLSASPGIDTNPANNVDNPSLFDAKGVDFANEGNPTPQPFNIWEE